MRRRLRISTLAASIAAALVAPAAHAVSLNPDGLGQALIYPYYTVRSVSGNAFHTYLSVGNSTADAKALRVRLREGRNGREVLSFNLFLGPNDMWAGALVATAEGAQLVTADTSCTDPPLVNGALATRRDAFTGANGDGNGDTLDRTREGFVEILEMATLTGESAAAITHNAAGVPMNCAALRSSATPSVAGPNGGLWGTLTLINVNAGQDFTLDATALADLASRPYFRPPGDPYPDFAAAEIEPVSTVVVNYIPPYRGGSPYLYRSTWARPQDAVSAVLMSVNMVGEYTLDSGTASATDLVLTFPTRHYYQEAEGWGRPFYGRLGWSPSCEATANAPLGDFLGRLFFDRESRDFYPCSATFPGLPCPGVRANFCASSGVASVIHADRRPANTASSSVLGSTTLGIGGDDGPIVTRADAGHFLFSPYSVAALTLGMGSEPDSVRVNLDTGETLTGRHTYFGLPVVGFVVRTFNNGTLSCAGAVCQGTYGSAFRVTHPSGRLVVP